MNYTELKLGELLSSANDTIKRNAVSILKELQKNILLCFWCKKRRAVIKDWREIDEMTGSYPSCKNCYNIDTEELLKIEKEKKFICFHPKPCLNCKKE